MSDQPGQIEPILDRLSRLHPKLIDLSLDRLRRLLAQLGHPELLLPPVIHVAGTNGKGSTCAFLRAMGEHAGWPVHVFTSPHLVRFNERIRLGGHLGGTLVDDDELSEALETAERVNAGAPITVFEIITAAALLLFAAHPAKLLVLEVGLGGRGDATNVVTSAVAAITSISIDHREFLGDTIEAIAAEKAGIMKPGIPVVTGAQDPAALTVLQAHADRLGCTLLARGRDWHVEPTHSSLRYTDASGTIDLPPLGLHGPYQHDNAGIAVAAFRAFGGPSAALDGLAHATWPARMQHLQGRLAASLPRGWELWLDGGHNPGAGVALAEALRHWHDRPTHLVVGMKQSKDVAEFLRPLLPLAATIWAVQEPNQHLAVPVGEIVAASGGVARPGPTVAAALAQLPLDQPGRALICGSLYLAGEMLKADALDADGGLT